MASWNLNGTSGLRSNPFPGHDSLPPRSPSSREKPQYSHYNTNLGSGSSLHASLDMPRSCSTNFIREEQPPWVEDLLSDLDSPVKNVAHRRSSSDPFTYLDANNNTGNETAFDGKQGRGLHNQRMGYDFSHGPSTIGSNRQRTTSQEQESNERHKFLWEYPYSNSLAFSSERVHQTEDVVSRTSHETGFQQQVGNMKPSLGTKMQSQVDSCVPTTKSSVIRAENCLNKPSAKLPDSTHVKQHNARRSRVRKLQYIVELEKRVRLLQDENCGVSAELEYLNKHHLILGMENRALKHWYESLSQLQLIKSSERDLLERELGRLQFLYQHQQ